MQNTNEEWMNISALKLLTSYLDMVRFYIFYYYHSYDTCDQRSIFCTKPNTNFVRLMATRTPLYIKASDFFFVFLGMFI